MAKFCVYCGRPLKEGEVCSCRTQAASAAPDHQTNTFAVQSSPAQPITGAAAPSQAGVYWKLAKDFFRAPASVLSSFAASGDRKEALVFVGAHALSFALFMIVLCNQIKASIHSMIDKLPSVFGSVDLSQYFDFSLGKIFFLSFFLSVAAALLFAGILLLFAKGVFKAETTYDQMLCVSAAGGVAGIPFLLAGLLVMFLSVQFGLYLAAFGILLQMLFVIYAFRKAGMLNSDKSVYALFLSFAVQLIVVAVFVKIFAPMYLPDALQDGIKQLQSGMAGASGLANLLR